MKKILLLLLLAVTFAFGFAGVCAYEPRNENNNYPSMGDGGWQANGCTLEQWMAFYDEYKIYINMSRETWLDKYPGAH